MADGFRVLKLLCEIGVLEEQWVGREKLFLHGRLMDLLVSDGGVKRWMNYHDKFCQVGVLDWQTNIKRSE